MTEQLSDSDLDRLLQASAAPLGAEAVAAAREVAQLAREAIEVAPPSGRRRYRGFAAAITTVVLLTGAGTVTAYELSIPPFQSLPEGLSRIRPPIVAEYDGVDGLRHRCEVFPEFVNLTSAQTRSARAWAARQDWSGYGDRLATRFTATTSTEEEAELFDAVDVDLRDRFADEMVPGIARTTAEAEESGRAALAGSSGTCRTVADGG